MAKIPRFAERYDAYGAKIAMRLRCNAPRAAALYALFCAVCFTQHAARDSSGALPRRAIHFAAAVDCENASMPARITRFFDDVLR